MNLHRLRKVVSATIPEGVGRCAIILVPSAILHIVLTWSRHSFLHVLIDKVSFTMYADFQTG